MKLFVGLGNPGDKYSGNRHNIGFMALERIADAHGFSPWRKKFQGLVSEGSIAGKRVMLLKPQTYMNDSGQAGGEAMRFLKLDADSVYVFHDEIDLAPGKIKVKAGGGNAGHNGLRSLTAHIGNDYRRVRLGVGHPGSKDAVSHFVLSDFAKADKVWLNELLNAVAAASGHLARGEDARFLSDVALKIQEAGGGADGAPDVEKKSAAVAKPKNASHPAGERASKRQSALAANLKKWLSNRKDHD